MPTRVDLPITTIPRTGVAVAAETSGDATNNHSFANDGRTFLLVRNADGVNPHTLTIEFTSTVEGQSVTSETVTIAASASKYVGPFDPSVHGGTCPVDVDSSQLKLSAYRLGG